MHTSKWEGCHFWEATKFFISRNQLSVLPGSLCQLPLEVLLVCNNKLISLPEEIGRIHTLLELDASCNEISNLPAQIGDLSILRSLMLRQNQLVQLPLELMQLRLERMDISCNRIVSLPVELRTMTSLVYLDLTNNPLLSPTASLCTRGRVHVFKFLELKSLKEDKKRGLLSEDNRRLRHGGMDVPHWELRHKRYTVDSGYSTSDGGLDKKWIRPDSQEEKTEPQMNGNISGSSTPSTISPGESTTMVETMILEEQFERKMLDCTVEELKHPYLDQSSEGPTHVHLNGTNTVPTLEERKPLEHIQTYRCWNEVGAFGGPSVAVGMVENGPAGGALLVRLCPLQSLLSVGLARAAGVNHPVWSPVKQTTRWKGRRKESRQRDSQWEEKGLSRQCESQWEEIRDCPGNVSCSGRKRDCPSNCPSHDPLETGVLFGAEYSREIVTDGSENRDCGEVQAVERVEARPVQHLISLRQVLSATETTRSANATPFRLLPHPTNTTNVSFPPPPSSNFGTEYKEALRQQRSQDVYRPRASQDTKYHEDSLVNPSDKVNSNNTNSKQSCENGSSTNRRPIQKVTPSRNCSTVTFQTPPVSSPLVNGNKSEAGSPPGGFYIKPSSPTKNAIPGSPKLVTATVGYMPPANGLGYRSPKLGSNGRSTMSWSRDVAPDKLSFTMRREFDKAREEAELIEQLRNPKLTMARCRRNVDNFLEACRRIGVEELHHGGTKQGSSLTLTNYTSVDLARLAIADYNGPVCPQRGPEADAV
uniref:Uncharacterized protein n=1 Tax=Timema genevievae TaxID=629358 RepID=A0A7R9K038_TIMGE|nr:unnamed protein product [Timema genevievae]